MRSARNQCSLSYCQKVPMRLIKVYQEKMNYLEISQVKKLFITNLVHCPFLNPVICSLSLSVIIIDLFIRISKDS